MQNKCSYVGVHSYLCTILVKVVFYIHVIPISIVYAITNNNKNYKQAFLKRPKNLFTLLVVFNRWTS